MPNTDEGWLAELRDLFKRTGRTRAHNRLRARLLMVFVVSAGVDLALSLVTWRLGGVTTTDEYLPTLAWTTSQLVVGGSSYAVGSGWGHVIEVVAHLYGFTVLATAAGSFAAFFHARHEERNTEEASAGR